MSISTDFRPNRMTQNSRTIFSGVRAQGTLGQRDIAGRRPTRRATNPPLMQGQILISELNYLYTRSFQIQCPMGGILFYPGKTFSVLASIPHNRVSSSALARPLSFVDKLVKRVPQTYHQPQRTASLPLLNGVNLNCSLSL